MRTAVTLSLLLAGTVACSQSPSPTSPSAGPSAVTSSVRVAPAGTTNLQPILAQLGRAQNFLASANHQLSLVAIPTDPCQPSDPCFENHLDSAVDFYAKANGVLDAVVPRIIPGDPCLPVFQTAVGDILGQTTATQGFLQVVANSVPQTFFEQVSHTSQVLTGPLACSSVD